MIRAFSIAALVFLSLPTPAAARPHLALFGSHAFVPVITGVDTASRSVLVRNTVAGARVDVYANGHRIATAVGSAAQTRVRLPFSLRPGTQVVGSVAFGASLVYTRGPTPVTNDYVTYHYDEGRTGWNPYETLLTPANVASASFGPLFTVNVDGDVIAQPLYAQNVIIPGNGNHDVLYVATENDSLYAFDADSGALLWQVSYVNPANGTTAVPATDLGRCLQYSASTIGITSTPVIDRTSGTIYLDAFVKQTAPTTSWHHYLHAVDMTTGLDKTGSPVDVGGTYAGRGGPFVKFIPLNQSNRPALLEDGGNIYVAFGSQCDSKPRRSFGWIFAYSADTLAKVGVFNAAPDPTSGLASFWMSGYGPAAGDGFIYAATGNGNFTVYAGGYDFGDAVLKLTPTLGVADYFEPWAEISIDPPDTDLGSGGVMMLPPQAGSPANLLVVAGKDRTIYLLDRTNLGQYVPGGPDNVVQALTGAVGALHGVWGGPAYYVTPSSTPLVYFAGSNDYLKAFALATSPLTQLVPAMQTLTKFGGRGGTIPVVSSNGQQSGSAIVWAIVRPPGAGTQYVGLRAFDANNLSTRLYNSTFGIFDNPHTYFFDVPTVVNGKVYASSGTSVTAFGLH